MRFEVMAKYGNKWSYKGIFEAKDSRVCAFRAQYILGRNVLRVRPEDSRDKWLVYRLTSAPMMI